jgi:ribosomal protein S18 acetylase RimI-like enzyme
MLVMVVKLIHGGTELLGLVRPMWEHLNLMNIDRSVYFEDHFKELDFETRMQPVISKGRKGASLVILAFDDDRKENIGYCVATIDPDHIAEIDSIFVMELYRNEGIGGRMLDAAIKWIDAFPVKETVLSVTFGNEDAPRFYERHGFHPRKTIFERK